MYSYGERKEASLFSKESSSAVGLTQPPMQSVPGAPSSGVKLVAA
jgi:hypothetical protein